MSNIKPIELSEKTKIDKSLISSYLSGRYSAKDGNLEKLAKVLNVNAAWLKGYDVPINNNYDNYEFDELELLLSKNKDLLNNDDKEMIRFIIEKRINETK